MKLPDVTDVGTRLPNAVRGQPSYPTSNPAANALQGFGNTLASVGFNAAEKANNEADKTRALGVQSRFLQFEDEWSKASVDRAEMVTPGAAGFTESLKKDYASAAKAFFKSVPAEEQPVYDQRLFDLESRLTNGASKFEREEKDRYAKGQIEDGQGVLLSRQAASPDNWRQVEQEGEQLIRNRPGASPTEADDEVRKWRKRRAMALFETRKALDEGEKLKLGVIKPAGPLPAKVSERSSAAMGYFQSRGYTKEQAAGIVGNLLAESKLNTGANNPGDGSDGTDSIGIGQWNSGRARALKAFAAENHADWRDFNIQLAFVDHELNTSEKAAGDRIRAASDVQSATDGMIMYERPAGSDKGARNAHNYSGRLSFAQQAAGGTVTGTDNATYSGADTSILTDPAPEYAALSYEDRLGMFEKSLADERNKRKELSVEAQGQIETTIANAPAAIQNTGSYSGDVPGLDKFVLAYGPDDGVKKFDAFNASMEVSQQAYDFRAMSTADINQAVQEAVPVSSGNDAALQADKFRVLQGAAEATIKARNADPSAYTQQVFPSVAQAWQQVQSATDNESRMAATQSAMAQTAAAQRQLGIANMQLLPGAVADNAKVKFTDETLPERERIDAVAGLVLSTGDPEQQNAVFEQLVKAGLPPETEGAMRAAARGDTAAAQELFKAAMVDPKDLAGSNPNGETPAMIADEIQSQVMDANQIGAIYYGFDSGLAENFVSAKRDKSLLINAVTLRLRNKRESLTDAVAGVARSLFGDVKPVSNGNVSILVPSNVDEQTMYDGLHYVMPQVEKALQQTLALPPDVTNDSRALLDATGKNAVQAYMQDGVWRNAGNGYAFLVPDAKTGDFVAVFAADGSPLIFTDEQVKAAAGIYRSSVPDAVITPDKALSGDDPVFGARP